MPTQIAAHVKRYQPLAWILANAAIVYACGGNDNSRSDAAMTSGEAIIAACPRADNLTDTTDWPDCLAGKTMTGKEPFNNSPCELRVGANGKFEYVRNGSVALTVPDRTQWHGATGTYQNTKISGITLFLARISPSLDLVPGQPRVIFVDLKFNGLAGEQDTVAVDYNDVDVSRKTYNCTMDLF